MKIRALRSLGAGWPSLVEGETGDVDDFVGKRLVDAQLAIDVTPQPEPQPVLKAVPPHATLTTEPLEMAAPEPLGIEPQTSRKQRR